MIMIVMIVMMLMIMIGDDYSDNDADDNGEC